jgi:plastocyanin
MAKRLLLLFAVASLAVAVAVAGSASSAPAAATTVKITKTGYNPASVSIVVGESVVFQNADTVAHTVSFKPTTGVKCPTPLPLAVPVGQSASCSFATVGTVRFTDPANKGKSFHGTLSVGNPPDVTVTAAPKSVVYRHTVTLSGKLLSGQSGQALQVMAQACGAATTTKLGNVSTTTGGAFTTQATPLKQTVYTVKSKTSTSLAATVKVQPLLHLRKVARHRFALKVSAAQSFAGKYANFQRYNAKLKQWRGVKRVLLHANTTGVFPTVFTTAKFRSSLKSKVRVRVVLKQAAVGSCYLAGKSNTIRS